MDLIGRVLRDRYELMDIVGKGGMSTVYLAKDRSLGSYWAVKHVKTSTNMDFAVFKEEVDLLSSLNHPDIPRIVDRIEVGDDYFVVMDFINGVSLGKKVLMEGPQKEKEVIEWAKMICEVLNYLHTVRENPIVYKDMKPENAMLTESGRIKLIDFGIAKECVRGHEQKSANVGTVGYAAPEQYKGGSNIFDERTDIYSVGATLFFLVTGTAPGKPPHATRPIRQINPKLSEGLEYIINKCTKDDPNERYQNCTELQNDLKDIEKINSKYRNQMKKRFISFAACFLACIFFCGVTFIGNAGVQSDKMDKYQAAYKDAMSHERNAVSLEQRAKGSGDSTLYAEAEQEYIKAGEWYKKAIEHKPDDLNTYLKLFNAMLPKNGSDDYQKGIKMAIDSLTVYVDNPSSPMYHNTTLMYQLVKKCLNIGDLEKSYLNTVDAYIKQLKQSADYKNGVLNQTEIESFDIINSYLSDHIVSDDFSQLNKTLEQLSKETEESSNLKTDDKLNNYFIIMQVYERYPNYLDNSYNKIKETAVKAKEIIDENADAEFLTFSNTVPLYEIVASSLYQAGIAENDSYKKEELFNSSITWFGYLEDLNVDLPESLALKKGNSYREIFDLHNNGYLSDPTVIADLNQSISIYLDILKKNPQSFLGQVNLTHAYLNQQLIKKAGDRDFSSAKDSYNKAVNLKNNNQNLSTYQLVQFSSLKQQMINAGLEV